MKKSATEYHRTLSEEEVHSGKIMIMQDALKFFPKPFKVFPVTVGGEKFDLTVEAIDCRCRGEAEPHQHYWLPLKDAKGSITWHRGATIVVRKGTGSAYTISNT